MDSNAPKLDLSQVTPHIVFSSEQGKVWLNEQRVMLFSQAALGKFRKEVYDTIGQDRCKAFFLRLGYQLGILDGELARSSGAEMPIKDRFNLGPELHALRGMVLPELQRLVVSEKGGEFICEVVWFNSYEVEICANEMGPMDEPGCWNLTGYASGYSSALLQREIFFQELECHSCGGDRCFAVGKPAAEWDNHEQLKRYYKPDPLLEELSKLQTTVEALKESLNEGDKLPNIVGSSKPFKHALEMVTKASDSKVSVLLLGETGVGKEVLARAVHITSDRADKPFIAVNCAAIPPDLIESELFGVEKGAYTGANQSRMGRFERADKGTIMLDEVIELTPRAQATLLRVLQESEFERVGDNKVRKIDVRVVAATNEDLSVAVQQGRFRADLYYRLSAYPINIPPLRERKEDIPLFVAHFLEKYRALYNKNVLGISDRGMEMLCGYGWPGNIRELENVVERAVILADINGVISVESMFPESALRPSEAKVLDSSGRLQNQIFPEGIDADGLVESLLSSGFELEKFEETMLTSALQKTQGNISKAARLVGLSRPAFAYRLKKMTVK
ncbi:Helix-turn-helix, Fis-type protein [marine gamma proteobacterium HTCC2207]|jgi:DNA-binding NtrC family response regulator/predicted hydrocarbon binding protein|uniref:Helix-turn-helix, Fis-type protein n=1 Tax=gamma proteobacterium HTCC2207 TaxID=314287 RepID=Q1YSI5_9GAMM|nr:Helix-turn-helix, Fis-type protein [marine gamma proteobacterium HTCC2207] [gamma proteobacterium HTCC2207]